MSDPSQTTRREIDKIDQNIVELLDQRARLALDLLKDKEADDGTVYSAPREAAVLENVEKAHQGPFPGGTLRSVFGEIVSACRHLQTQDRIVVLGERFGWVHDAALNQFGSSSSFTTVDAGDEVAELTRKDPTAMAFFHLSSAGTDIHLLLEAMLAGKLQIAAEIPYLPRFSLVSAQRIEVPEVTDLFATRECLSALRHWVLSLSFPIRINICRSVEEVVENMVEAKPFAGLIPQGIAKTLGLNLIQGNIEPQGNHPRRCVTVCGKAAVAFRKGMKTTVLCTLPQEPGALHAVLAPLPTASSNLLGVEMFSYHGKPWKDLFLIDFASPETEKKLASVLEKMAAACKLFMCLGTYPVMR